jgi:uncharacterized sporulation protein YeaH/YhbH (DUF444 family)
VHPFVAYVNEQPEFKADSNEVEYILSCSVEQLMHKDNLQSEVWNLHNKRVKVPFYNIKNEKIWGATAMIISEFIEVIKRIN